MSSDTTRPTLLDRVRDHKNANAWMEFDSIYRPILIRFACSRGLGIDAAEEVAQECLYRVSQEIGEFEYDPSRRFRSWLFTITHRIVLDHHRRRNRRHELQQDTAAFQMLADDGETPEQAFERLENQGYVQHCLELVREDLRGEKTYEVFRRRVFDGWSVVRICQEYDMTREQVDGIKFRVGRKIAAKINELFREDPGERV